MKRDQHIQPLLPLTSENQCTTGGLPRQVVAELSLRGQRSKYAKLHAGLSGPFSLLTLIPLPLMVSLPFSSSGFKYCIWDDGLANPPGELWVQEAQLHRLSQLAMGKAESDKGTAFS